MPSPAESGPTHPWTVLSPSVGRILDDDSGVVAPHTDRGLDHQARYPWAPPVDQLGMARRHLRWCRDETGLEGVDGGHDLDGGGGRLTVPDQRLDRVDPVGVGHELVEN